MTACCRAFVAHGFDTWKLNRITIECATENVRSRAIPERLGFKLDGIVRGIEWLTTVTPITRSTGGCAPIPTRSHHFSSGVNRNL